MTQKKQKQVGIAKVSLSQRKYQDGGLYLSQVMEDGMFVALDVRFFHEDGNALRPTRAGFRVPAASLAEMFHVLLSNATDIDHTLWSDDRRKLLARYVDDEYGQALDIRYYLTGHGYKGWEKRGIRLRLEDFQRLQFTLRESKEYLGNADGTEDLFQGKVIGTEWKKQGSKVKEKLSVRKSERNGTGRGATGFINEYIKKLIG